jgi:hypothetical protein
MRANSAASSYSALNRVFIYLKCLLLDFYFKLSKKSLSIFAPLIWFYWRLQNHSDCFLALFLTYNYIKQVFCLWIVIVCKVNFKMNSAWFPIFVLNYPLKGEIVCTERAFTVRLGIVVKNRGRKLDLISAMELWNVVAASFYVCFVPGRLGRLCGEASFPLYLFKREVSAHALLCLFMTCQVMSFSHCTVFSFQIKHFDTVLWFLKGDSIIFPHI